MSQIAAFQLLPREKLASLQNIAARDPARAAEWIHDLEQNAEFALPDADCTGEVFTALFDFLEAEREVDCDDGGEFFEAEAFWLGARDPLDLRFFGRRKAREMLAALPKRGMEEAELADFLSEDWESEPAHMLAGIRALRENLRKVDSKHYLVYYLT